MAYKFLEHTADIEFEADGNDLEYLFINSFQALKEAFIEKIPVKEKKEHTISIQGTDLENLLYKFLEEVLFLLDSKNFIASKIKSIAINEKKLQLLATLSGDDAGKYKFTNAVKAITYNSMKVSFNKAKKKWEAKVVLDV
jgi:SHS2 domain-containing protein